MLYKPLLKCFVINTARDVWGGYKHVVSHPNENNRFLSYMSFILSIKRQDNIFKLGSLNEELVWKLNIDETERTFELNENYVL